MKQGLIYLACPYSHKEHYMLVARHLMVNKVTANLMSKGMYIYSPISHSHPVAESGEAVPRGWDWWGAYDRHIITLCVGMIVLRLPGWETSTGVQAEIKWATELGLPIEYIDYDCNPTYQDMVTLAMQMEVQMAPTLAGASTMEMDSNASNPTTICFTTDIQGVLRNTTNGAPLGFGLVHGV